MSDLALLLDHLFISGRPLPNLDEANIDGDPERRITIGDASVLIDHLFVSGRELPYCPALWNHPPDTRVIGVLPNYPYIDAVAPDNPSGGVPLRWLGSDPVDFPYGGPVYQFEYRLYGPYDEAEWEELSERFLVRVFETNDGLVLRSGLEPPARLIACDTSYDNGQQIIECDTVLIDTVTVDNAYGRVDTILDVDNPDFYGDPELFKPVAVSGDENSVWSYDAEGEFYDLYAAEADDETSMQTFLFWVRSRDAVDSTVYDPTPALVPLNVINPCRERDVLVLNMTFASATNHVRFDSLAAFWQRALDYWSAQGGGLSGYDPTLDFVLSGRFTDSDAGMLLRLLSHKAVIAINDAAESGAWSSLMFDNQCDVRVAMDFGVNVWAASRSPFDNSKAAWLNGPIEPSASYRYAFGIERINFSNWYANTLFYDPGERMEDFVTARPEQPEIWPTLDVDSVALHGRYAWQTELGGWRPDLAALPEVDWLEPAPEAEVLYRYGSMYGSVNEVDSAFSFDDLPVAVRVDRGRFRTVQTLFGPHCFAEAGAMDLVSALLSWLTTESAR